MEPTPDLAFANPFNSSSSGYNGNGHENGDANNNSNGSISCTSPVISQITPEAVQQAAAALNIPWSDVEQAILAQSLLASLPLAIPTMGLRQPATPLTALLMAQLAAGGAGIPFSSATAAAAAATAIATSMIPNQSASINISHDGIMDTSPPCTPTPLSPSPIQSPILQSPSEPSSAPSSPLLPSTAAARPSILSCSQTRLPSLLGSSKTIQATTYKSTYRTASLIKRNREHEEPPSVLDGLNVTDLDESTLKRAKNTDAARRSRFKKQVRMDSLEQRVAELEVENSMFENKLNEVELQRSLLAEREHVQQARIQELEFMLAALRDKLSTRR